MNIENLKKSYMLIGPAGIGKSLIAKELSSKTGLPIISIDEIISYAIEQSEINFPHIFVNKKTIARFYKHRLKELYSTYQKKSLAEKKQNEIIESLTNLFLFYKKELNGFKEIQKLLVGFYEQKDKLTNIFSSYADAFLFQNLTIQIFKIIESKIDKPVIFDMPCNFGWFIQNQYSSDFDYQKLNDEMSKILNNIGFSILLEPGEDFEERSPTSHYYEFLFNNRENYNQSDLIISTNQLFFNPSEKAIKDREDFNPNSQLKREELLNKAELNNICDQIIEMAENLKQIEK